MIGPDRRNSTRGGGEVGVWASCMDARGMADAELVGGAHRSSLEQLTAGTSDAHQILVF
jgi:uncharacterized protein involved in oxidation of intracellular sulfur